MPTIYLDNAASAPIDPRVLAAMTECLGDATSAGNPSSTHGYGQRAAARIEDARAEVAALVGATPDTIVFTSGATEADNLAVLGAARGNAALKGRHVVTSRTEHKAVLAACEQLEREGHALTYLTPQASGLIPPEQVEAALRPDTALVSLMLVNNETGVVQDCAGIGAILAARGILFHVDAAQAAGRVALDVHALQADLVSLASHKIHGPIGVGALYVRRQPRPLLQPLLFGGGQERGLRSGTMATHQVVGMGMAYRLAREAQASEAPRLRALCERLWARLDALGDVYLNGAAAPRAPHILSVSFAGVDGEALRAGVDGIAVSGGAACSAGTAEASYVLRALGRDDALAGATLRFSVGRTTTLAQIDRAADLVVAEVERLRALAPATARVAGATRA